MICMGDASGGAGSRSEPSNPPASVCRQSQSPRAVTGASMLGKECKPDINMAMQQARQQPKEKADA